jgi:putative glutamine amidotransferase
VRFRIGISACFFHADPNRPIFKGKTLLYLEQSIAHWLASKNVLYYMIPNTPANSPIGLQDLADDLDALVLQGGSDVSPKCYGEEALKPEWNGDYVRDQYEIELVKLFALKGKPILGICRGLQLLNVAYGGTLFQDIETQVPNSLTHRNWSIYDQNFHTIDFVEGSHLQKRYGGLKRAKVNSVHHQAIKDLAKGFQVEARSEKDNIIEAVRHKGPGFISAVQWHPEFHDPRDSSVLDSSKILEDFYDAIALAKNL